MGGEHENDRPVERRGIATEAVIALQTSITELRGEQSLVRQSVEHVSQTLERIEKSFSDAATEAAKRLAETREEFKTDIATLKADTEADLERERGRIDELRQDLKEVSRKVWGTAGGSAVIAILASYFLRVIGGGA